MLSWQAGIILPGTGARNLVSAIMFPALMRIDNSASFNLLVARNEHWKVVNLEGPINGKFFFEIGIEVAGAILPDSRRCGMFDARGITFPNDPNNKGVTFFVTTAAPNAGSSSLDWDDLEDLDFVIPNNTPTRSDIMDFWDAYP